MKTVTNCPTHAGHRTSACLGVEKAYFENLSTQDPALLEGGFESVGICHSFFFDLV